MGCFAPTVLLHDQVCVSCPESGLARARAQEENSSDATRGIVENHGASEVGPKP